ncbi:hypothetical protein P692DRAFT_20838872 [Suillus brevipes Sb2]|nr:hypothetical protein P692DRAFT_20838872 [Suillus brevipes Sb2]
MDTEATLPMTPSTVSLLSNKTVQPSLMIIIEHRFFGFSNPYDNLKSQSLALLTIQQAIDDLVYFATTADLPMCGGAVKPGQAPWILIGGSCSGVLTSYTMVNKPGIFWAGYGSSATVQTITDYYDYFTRICHRTVLLIYRQ